MRLLSWNIHKGIGGRDRRYSLARIIDAIEAENPDLICLQEVDRLVRRAAATSDGSCQVFEAVERMDRQVPIDMRQQRPDGVAK